MNNEWNSEVVTEESNVDITVDQSYNASSENPQSGTAVAEALSSVPASDAIILNSTSTWSDFYTPYSAGRRDIYFAYQNENAPFYNGTVYAILTGVRNVTGTDNSTRAVFNGTVNFGGGTYSLTATMYYASSTLTAYNRVNAETSYSSGSSAPMAGIAVAQAVKGTRTDYTQKAATVSGGYIYFDLPNNTYLARGFYLVKLSMVVSNYEATQHGIKLGFRVDAADTITGTGDQVGLPWSANSAFGTNAPFTVMTTIEVADANEVTGFAASLPNAGNNITRARFDYIKIASYAF